MIINRGQANNFEYLLQYVQPELAQFSQIYRRISDDSDVRELYVHAGLLEKYLDLQKNISKKLSG